MKLFGEFLIERNILNGVVLVEALFKQMNQLPSGLEILFQKKRLDGDQVLQILKTQQESHYSVEEAAKSLGLWEESYQEEIDSYVAENRVPLGQILVQSGAVTLQQMTSALDEFLAEAREATNVQVQEAEPLTPVADRDYSPYLELMQESKARALMTLLALSTLQKVEEDRLKRTVEILHGVKSAARLVELNGSEQIIERLESLLKAVIEKGTASLTSEVTKKIETVSNLSIELLVEIANTVEAGGPESLTLQNPEFMKKEETLRDTIEVLKFDLEFLS